ncbi:MAG: hypothetical protein KF773_36805 [Deltaproteobacteria bacterium]|nr:hypothetical protein [Deltaproteobacteria bacterium]
MRTHLYRHEARRAWAYAIALFAVLALALPVLGHLVGQRRATAFAVLGIGGMAAVLALISAVVVGLVAPRRRWGDDAELARWVGTRKQDVASDLLSSVQLASTPVRPGSPSKELVGALLATTSARLDGVEPEALIPTEQLSRAQRWALAGTIANLAAVVLAPAAIAEGWKRLVVAPSLPYDGAQLSAVPLVGDLDAHLDFPAYTKRPPLTLESASGDVRGLPGTVVTLRARTLVPAVSGELLVEMGEGAPLVVPVDVKLDRVTAHFTITKSARYRFAITSPDGSRAVETIARAIDTETDQAPTVQLMVPAEPLDVSNLRRVELAWVMEDDFGLSSAELVWEAGARDAAPARGAEKGADKGAEKDRGRKPLQLDGIGARAQGRVLWDIAEVSVPSGGEVRYWIEAKDNDTVSGAKVGRSREYHLKVVSPRERHEETLGRQQEVAEKLLRNLALRLTMKSDDAEAREELARQLREAVVELGAVTAAYEKDPHTSDAMRKALAQMHRRLDELLGTEQRIVPKGAPAKRGAYTGIDAQMIGELEEDAIILADWLDRERMEGLLDVSDEIVAHQKRLADLLAQYQRTKDARLLDEIEREMRALDRSFAELDKHRRGMPEDVLDQYVHRDAMHAAQGSSCLDDVRKLVRAGQVAQAQQKLEQCRAQTDRASSALEGSLAGLRGDKFTEEQKKLDEVMNELRDVAKDQDDISAEANRLFESYAQKAAEVGKEARREASKKVGALVEKLRKKLKDVDATGLTPFAKEELDIVERRLNDVEHMVSEGDLGEALGMAHQAKSSLDTIAGELEAALEDDPKSKWADATQQALDGVVRSVPVAKELITELQGLSPKPEKIMSPDDLAALERLRRRQAMTKERTKRLGERTKAMGPELPGDTAAELAKKLGAAGDKMGTADERMKAKDPSGTRQATRAASDALAKARERARQAARQAQEGAVADEPIKIPGADEYRPPQRFREDLLEAMKKKGASGYDEQLKRYYEELIK